MLFLYQQKVNEEEESIRLSIRGLSDETRQKIFAESKRKVKDPDTYAALNYALVAGLHHCYLGQYLRVLIELGLFVFGIYLLINDITLGAIFVASMLLLEIYELFRSQITVQHYNNQVMKVIVDKYKS
jgi:hypothetical protein